jgi:hypothetical protein
MILYAYVLYLRILASPRITDMILGDEPVIFKVVLSHYLAAPLTSFYRQKWSPPNSNSRLPLGDATEPPPPNPPPLLRHAPRPLLHRVTHPSAMLLNRRRVVIPAHPLWSATAVVASRGPAHSRGQAGPRMQGWRGHTPHDPSHIRVSVLKKYSWNFAWRSRAIPSRRTDCFSSISSVNKFSE